MDELPGNPWILNKSELIREKKREIKLQSFLQWNKSEECIEDIFEKYDVWKLAESNTKFIYNHRTNRLILDNDKNQERIKKYDDFIDMIYLEFNHTTGWYNFNKQYHTPDKVIYQHYNKYFKNVIETEYEKKRHTYDWELTKEEKLKREIFYLKVNISKLNTELTLKLADKFDMHDNLSNLLSIIDDISDNISEGKYLEIMDILKLTNDNLNGIFSNYY